MLNELSEMYWDILCLSETRTPDDDIILLGGHRLLTTLMDTPYAGVGILINKRWADSILKIGKVSGRLMYIDVRIGMQVFRFLSIYVPHAGYDWSEFETCFDSIREVLEDARRKHIKYFIGGDFNTQINVGNRGLLSNIWWKHFRYPLPTKVMMIGTNSGLFVAAWV